MALNCKESEYSSEEFELSSVNESPITTNSVSILELDSIGKVVNGGNSENGSKIVVTSLDSISVSESIKNGFDMRQAVYLEWKKRKHAHFLEKKHKEDLEKKQTSERDKLNKEGLKRKCERAIHEWEVKKEQEATIKREKLKNLKDEKVRKEQEEKEKLTKDIQKAMQTWKEKKKVKLAAEVREKKRLEKEVAERKKEEELEKEKISNKAYQVWKEKKKKYMKESRNKQAALEKKKDAVELKNKMEKEKSAEEAYRVWKSNKEYASDSSFTSSNSSASLVRPAWCPARSIKYDNSMLSDSKPYLRKTQSPKQKSFIVQAEEAGKKPKKKTIQVCCQTVEYWCSCSD